MVRSDTYVPQICGARYLWHGYLWSSRGSIAVRRPWVVRSACASKMAAKKVICISTCLSYGDPLLVFITALLQPYSYMSLLRLQPSNPSIYLADVLFVLYGLHYGTLLAPTFFLAKFPFLRITTCLTSASLEIPLILSEIIMFGI